MDEITYVFIDGAYLQETFRETILSTFGDEYEIDLLSLKHETRSRRAFYYDCLDNIQKQGENQADFNARVHQKEAYLDSIRSLEGFHVKEGFLQPGRNKQQKEVDVLLAVDMMWHAFHRNMTRAVLISGDRDFKPVVQSVAQSGTYVEVWFRKQSGSRPLAREADNFVSLDIEKMTYLAKRKIGDPRGKKFPIYKLFAGGIFEDPAKQVDKLILTKCTRPAYQTPEIKPFPRFLGVFIRSMHTRFV